MVAGFGASNTIVRSKEVWQPPPFGHIKINVDASFVESLSVASVGVGAKSCTGDIIVSSWDFIGLCSGVDEAELRACLAGLYIGISLNMPIILETDCAFVASFLANESCDRSSLIDLKKEALSIIRLLKNFKLSKINRRANSVAHEIAKIAKFSFDNRCDGFLFNNFPPCVAPAVMNDCNDIFN